MQAYEVFDSKYAFLEIYRGLETTFLHVILDEINSGFFKDPRASLERGLKSVEKERAQLASMLVNVQLAKYLNVIASKVDLSAQSGNDFALALQEAFKNDNSKPPPGVATQAWRGAWFVYQIRCAIAHAGSTGIVYEDYADASNLVSSLQVYMEEMALIILGFAFSEPKVS